jgi:hypothetical protein
VAFIGLDLPDENIPPVIGRCRARNGGTSISSEQPRATQMPNKLTVPGGSIRDIELPSLLIYIPIHRKLF